MSALGVLMIATSVGRCRARRENTGAYSDQDKIRIQQVACVRKSESEATCRVHSTGLAGPERVDLILDIAITNSTF